MNTTVPPYSGKADQKPSVGLPSGPFGRQTASALVSAYRNVFIENDAGTHFQLVIRDAQGGLIWRAWNFEAEAGFGLTTYIREYGVRR
ncbi:MULTISPECIES: DUF905 family protein [unclassified Pantoea]|uniref:DUF905 family protein n=1 Tax=unclassified Pantoea TaxID=2630326 RepID=UPI002B4799B3|nr:DUF905 family protein [Pantoea sp. JZ29]